MYAACVTSKLSCTANIKTIACEQDWQCECLRICDVVSMRVLTTVCLEIIATDQSCQTSVWYCTLGCNAQLIRESENQFGNRETRQYSAPSHQSPKITNSYVLPFDSPRSSTRTWSAVESRWFSEYAHLMRLMFDHCFKWRIPTAFLTLKIDVLQDWRVECSNRLLTNFSEYILSTIPCAHDVCTRTYVDVVS